MYQIIDEKDEQQKYNQIVDKITPQSLGLKPTTDFAQYAQQTLIDENPAKVKEWIDKGSIGVMEAGRRFAYEFDGTYDNVISREEQIAEFRRKHPVTGQIKPHTGVDYAAPMGTPVVALGDGTVISAGWTDNGGGNVIKIKHNSVYTTGYLHLKGFASGIKKGAKVRQGQVIGYVGSTGRSTGPHLDFRVWRNGSPIDPLTMKSPAAEPLPKEYKPKLDSLYNHYISLVNGD